MKYLITMLALLLMSCGPYYQHGHEETYAWTTNLKVNVHWDVDDPHYPGFQSTDLDLELLVPLDDAVTAYSTGFTDCEHSGDDFGYLGGGSESLDCFYPYPGVYEVLLVNHSEYWQLAEVKIYLNADDGYEVIQEYWLETHFIAPWATEITGLSVY